MRLTNSLISNVVRQKESRRSTLPLRLCGAVAVLLAITPNLPAQELDPVVLVVDVDNFVQYRGDTSDLTKLATMTNPTVGEFARSSTTCSTAISLR